MSNQKSNEVVLAKQLIAGIKKHLPNASVTLAGAAFTPAQVESFLQTLVDLRAGVDAARAVVKAKITAEDAQAPPLRSQMAALVSVVRAAFANSPDVLADFGLKPKKVKAPLTIEQKAAAAAKRAATRQARHIMGTKQKKALTGTITTIVTQSPSTASPRPAGSPAGAAPSTATPASAQPMPASPTPGAPTNAGAVTAAHGS